MFPKSQGEPFSDELEVVDAGLGVVGEQLFPQYMDREQCPVVMIPHEEVLRMQTSHPLPCFDMDLFQTYSQMMGEPAIDPVETSAQLHRASRELRERLRSNM